MAIESVIKCSDITASLEFYTQVLDFNVVQAPDPDPSAFMSRYAFMNRDGSGVHLSSHGGDGVYGNALYIRVPDIDVLYQAFVDNGLVTHNSEVNPCVRIKPVEQTWGMREFNRLTFGHELSD